jgi:hypothetical protein
VPEGRFFRIARLHSEATTPIFHWNLRLHPKIAGWRSLYLCKDPVDKVLLYMLVLLKDVEQSQRHDVFRVLISEIREEGREQSGVNPKNETAS